MELAVLTIFDHHEFVANNRIAYRGHTLDLATEVPQLLAELRAYFKTIADTTLTPLTSCPAVSAGAQTRASAQV